MDLGKWMGFTMGLTHFSSGKIMEEMCVFCVLCYLMVPAHKPYTWVNHVGSLTDQAKNIAATINVFSFLGWIPLLLITCGLV